MPLRRNPKQTGELAEVAFLHKAVSLGFVVSKPYGDSAPYDFVLGAGRRLWRVQIKSANHIWQGAYYINTHWRNSFHAENYSQDHIDFLVGYIPPRDAWYIFPVSAIAHVKSVRVYPHLKRRHGLYEHWRDRWELLKDDAGHKARTVSTRQRSGTGRAGLQPSDQPAPASCSRVEQAFRPAPAANLHLSS